MSATVHQPGLGFPPVCPRSAAVARVALGLLLVAAAALKGYERLASAPTAFDTAIGGKWLVLFAAELELLLGLWLISGRSARVAWPVALACFAVFAVINALQVWYGEKSCGCFGPVHVDPKYVFVLDIVCCIVCIVSALRLGRGGPIPVEPQVASSAAGLSWRIVAPTMCLTMSAAGLFAKAHFRPSPNLFKTVTLDSVVHDFGTTQGNQKLRHEFRISNNGSESIRIVRALSTCGCTTAEGVIGLAVAPGDSTVLPVTLGTGDAEGEKSGTVTFYFQGDADTVPAWHSCMVRASVVQDYRVEPTLVS
jgi:hypothetical protein